MDARVRFLGHSAFEIRSRDATILIDPFLNGNPVEPVSDDELTPDVVIVTHGHSDHVGDTVSIARRTGALVIANYEVVNWLNQQRVEKTHPQHIGGSFRHDFGSVKLTIAHHGSGLPDGSCSGNPGGVLLRLADGAIYHAGDTALTYDLKLIASQNVDLAIVPIGANFTMGPDDAVTAVQFIEPKRVIPCHYSTWPLIDQNADAWAERVRSETSAEPVVIKPGESCELRVSTDQSPCVTSAMLAEFAEFPCITTIGESGRRTQDKPPPGRPRDSQKWQVFTGAQRFAKN